MSETVKNNVFADKLKDLKLDYSAYGKLPMRLDVIVIEVPKEKPEGALIAQFDKLTYMRQHLQKIDGYIKMKTDETIGEWDARLKAGLSTYVLKELRNYNNETGGISAYFHDLQKKYNEEEAKYDKMESQCKAPEDIEKAVSDLRTDRAEKRKTRAEELKVLVKDLKKDGKGYLFVAVEDAPTADKKEETVLAADGKTETKIVEKEVDEIKKSTKKVGVVFAGITIFLTIVAVAASMTGKKTE